jgi:hypothetical protein
MPATSNTPSQDERPILFRICIGGMCFVYLLVLIVLRFIFVGFGFSDSISDYYYIPAIRNVFVGGLCILATLLMCYRYQSVDDLASYIAGLCAIGVALFPKAPLCPPSNVHCASQLQIQIGLAHAVFAGLFFLIIALMVFFLFTRTNQDPPMARKKERNVIYWVCGGGMFACALCIFVTTTFLSQISWLQSSHLVFWFESAALVFFIAAWFTKGQVFLKDEGNGWSSLSEVWTYVCDIVPDAIQSFLTAFSAKASSDGKGTKNPTSSMQSSEIFHPTPKSSFDDRNKQEDQLTEEKVDARGDPTPTDGGSGVSSSEL